MHEFDFFLPLQNDFFFWNTWTYSESMQRKEMEGDDAQDCAGAADKQAAQDPTDVHTAAHKLLEQVRLFAEQHEVIFQSYAMVCPCATNANVCMSHDTGESARVDRRECGFAPADSAASADVAERRAGAGVCCFFITHPSATVLPYLCSSPREVESLSPHMLVLQE